MSKAISEKLLDAIASWPVVKLPNVLYHGCRSNDLGVDAIARKLTGNKWFSINPVYAGHYPWHEVPGRLGIPLRARVVIDDIYAVNRPSTLDCIFPQFLAECFPNHLEGYGLSRLFQDSLALHLRLTHQGRAVGYVALNEEEVLIPTCERWIKHVGFAQLTATKEEYLKAGGLLEIPYI